jgi:hypothetical protein
MDDINKRIETEICQDTIIKLSDEKLLSEYIRCKSVKNAIKKLDDILNKYINDDIKEKIINEYLLELIPSGTKGVIRGNKFNNIIKNKIINLNLDDEKFEICFEKKCNLCLTSEIPDWYIMEKSCKKLIIGMNQLDLWNGGQQLNRGFKYIENTNYNNSKTKLLCVVCNKIIFTSDKNKAYKLFKIGFENNTLCYLNNLENIIKSYFLL